MSPQSVSRFMRRYPGVEGFYFVNRNADLGFIRPTDAKPVKETFPQLNDRQFMRTHPRFVDDLENFLRDLQELSRRYFNDGDTAMEIGHVIPAGNDDHEWNSATLMVHEAVIDAITTDHEVKRQRPAEDSSPQQLTVDKLQGDCSVHRGINYLAKYLDTEGSHSYFPVLFFRSAPASDGTDADDPSRRSHDTSLRVINLLWRSWGSDGVTTDQPNAVFDVLRHNLETRGAIARDKLSGGKAAASEPLAAVRQLADTDLLTSR